MSRSLIATVAYNVCILCPLWLFVQHGLTDPFRFELYERNYGRSKSDKEYSIKLSISEGAHSSNVLDSALDARHSLNVQQRRLVHSCTPSHWTDSDHHP
jgi:hypothetical protein